MLRVSAAGLLVLSMGGLAACRFDNAGVGGGGDDVPDLDAGRDPDGAPADARPIDAAQPDAAVAAFCDPDDPDLVACWRFDDPVTGGLATVTDGAGASDGLALGVSAVAGPAGHGMALGLSEASEVFVPESDALDLTAPLSIEVWVKPASTNETRSGLLDNNGQYAIFLSDAGEPRCVIGTSSLDGLPVSLGVWTHLACVYDGMKLRLYVDGAQISEKSLTAAVPTDGLDGLHLGEDGPNGGDQLDGAIDDVRIFSRARTAAELCAAAAPNCP